MILAQFGSQALASTGFDHDANGNLTAVRAAVAGPPVIETQPRNQIVGAGSGAGLSVVIYSSSPASFQWKREDGSNVAGATSDSLYFPEVTPSMEGRYYVIVTNASGSLTSAMAVLYVDSNWNSLPDTWEMTYFRNLSQRATGDFDGDGISNLDEYNQGLNPAVREIVYWIAASGDLGNAANWSRGRLPIEGDTAVINSGTFTIPSGISLRASQVTVNVPYTAPASHVNLRITGKWNFNGPFTLTSGWRFTVDGDAPGAEVTVSGTTSLNAGSLTVSGGAKLTFGNLQTFVHLANRDADWVAQEADSELVFSNLSSITGPATAGAYLSIQGITGGVISFPMLTTITKPSDGNTSFDTGGIWLQARSSGRLSAPVLTIFNDNDNYPNSRLLADSGGILMAPQLLTVKGASIDLNEESDPQRFISLVNARSIEFNSGSGTLMTSNLRTITGNATLTVTRGANVTFGSLNSVDNLTRIQVDYGSKARFNSVISYVHPAIINHDVEWVAKDVNSELVFPNMASITGPSTAGAYLSIQALTGGVISFPLLTSIAKPSDGNTFFDSGVALIASSGAISAPVLASLLDNDSRPKSSITRGTTGVLALPNLASSRILGVTLTGTKLPATAAPLINTPGATAITASGASLGGNVSGDGGSAITERGVVYALSTTNANPLIGGTGVTKLTDRGTTGSFTLPVAGLPQATTYRFKAYAINSLGTSYTSVANFTTLSNDASLRNLTLSSGTLSPAFASGTTSYTASLPYTTSSITVTPTKTDANASIRVIGKEVASGTASGAIPLPEGATTNILVEVTAQNGIKRSYTIAVARSAPPEMKVLGNKTSIADNDTTPVLTDHTDFGSVLVSSGKVVRTFTIRNTGKGALSLTGATRVVVGGTDGVDFRVTAQPAASVPAGGTVTFQVSFDPSFSGARVATLSIPNNDANENPYNFTIKGTGTGSLLAPLRYAPVVLSAASDRSRIFGKTGTVATKTSVSSNADLSNLKLSAGIMNSSFASATTRYSASVPSGAAPITVTPTSEQANATLAVRANAGAFDTVTSGNSSTNLALNPGENTIDVRVTAEDGVTQKTYSVQVAVLAPPGGAPIASWRLKHFGTDENSGNSADLAMPDGDGIPNLVKYALVMTPGQNGSSALPQIALSGGAANRLLTLKFQRDPSRSDVTIVVEVQSGLASTWSEITRSVNGAEFTGVAAVSERAGANGVNSVTVQDVQGDASCRFMRVRVER